MAVIEEVDDATKVCADTAVQLNQIESHIEDGEFQEAQDLLEDQIEMLQFLQAWLQDQPKNAG